MDRLDDHQVAFNASNPQNYGFEPLTGDGSMNLDFSPLPDLEPLSGPVVPPNISAPADIDHPVLYNRPRQAQRVPAMPHRRTGLNLRSGLAAQRSAVRPVNKAKLVTEQFGHAAARLRSFDERFSKLEQQHHELLRRLGALEKRMSGVQLGLQKAEEGHEEIAEMVKASVAFLNELNGEQASVQPGESDLF